jgi:hypothetical protein
MTLVLWDDFFEPRLTAQMFRQPSKTRNAAILTLHQWKVWRWMGASYEKPYLEVDKNNPINLPQYLPEGILDLAVQRLGGDPVTYEVTWRVAKG